MFPKKLGGGPYVIFGTEGVVLGKRKEKLGGLRRKSSGETRTSLHEKGVGYSG